MTGAARARRDDERAFGFWLYLMSDAIVFALLFATYAVLLRGTAGGPGPQELFSLPRTFVETLLLLLSSATYALAAREAAAGERARAVALLVLTFALGAGFLAMEFAEFRGMVARGAGPGRSGFLSGFFALVGAHGLHVAAGLAGILAMTGQLVIKGASAPVLSRLHRLGLFWHFLDIVWIGIFSVVYLPGVLG